jgi:uncharacterized membrane protein YesL
MAGIFGLFDYTKPGPGVPEPGSMPPKKRIIIFFEIFGRKFWNFIKLNMMFCLFNIPGFIAAFFASMYIFQNVILNDAETDLYARFIIASVLVCIPVITLGPAQAGFTYILRNYAREEHAFLWWDFKDNALKNLKQSMIICLIDLLAVVLFGVAVNYYMNIGGNNLLMTFLSAFLIMSFIIFMIMHMYIYPLMVTFELKIKQIYKNAMIFAIAKIIPNIGILLLCVLIVLATFYFHTLIGMVLLFFVTISFVGFIINFYVYGKLKKYMLDKAEKQPEEQ